MSSVSPAIFLPSAAASVLLATVFDLGLAGLVTGLALSLCLAWWERAKERTLASRPRERSRPRGAPRREGIRTRGTVSFRTSPAVLARLALVSATGDPCASETPCPGGEDEQE